MVSENVRKKWVMIKEIHHGTDVFKRILKAKANLDTLGCEVLSYSKYSPDLVPRNYHLSPNLKRWL